MIVPEFSATLEYPGEIRVGMNGDHLTIAKYSSKREPNFIKIVTKLRKIVTGLQVSATNAPESSTPDNL